MNIYERKIGINLSKYVVFFLLSVTIVVAYFYFTGPQNTKIGALLGGLLASTIAVLVQFLLTWNEHREVERLKKMGFLDVLENRKNRKSYYEELLKKPKKKIDFIGNTAYDFLEDFAKEETEASEEDRLVITAIQRGVTVRILVSSKDHLKEKKHFHLEQTIEKVASLKKMTSSSNLGSIELKQLNTPPTHTYVRVDGICIFGPIFPNVDSELTPAIHASTESPYLEQYLEHFESVWSQRAN